MSPAFTSEPALLVSTEWTCGIELVVSIRPDHSGPQLVHDLENLAALIRPHAGAQAVGGVIRALDCFLRGAECHHAQDRSKDFFLRNPMGRGHAGEKTRRIPITFRRQSR